MPRSFLFVPGDSPEKLEKSWNRGADALIFDLEDAVPEPEKSTARKSVSLALQVASGQSSYALVRINGYSTSQWVDDVRATISSHVRAFVLPKCECPEAVATLAALLDSEEKSLRLVPKSISIFAMIESARGLVEIPRIAEVSRRLQGLVLGGEDYCLDMGVSRTKCGAELQYARAHLAVQARAFGCLAIDTIYSDFGDAEGLRRDTETAKQLGFTGKLAIHPAQLETIHAAFAPSDADLVWARKVIEAFTVGQTRGSTIVTLDGKMVDPPIVERARRLLVAAGNVEHGRRASRLLKNDPKHRHL